MKKILFILVLYCFSRVSPAQVFYNNVNPVITPVATGTHAMYVPPPPGFLSQNNLSTLLLKKYGNWPAGALLALERARFIWENSVLSSTYTEVELYWDNSLASTTIAVSRPKQLVANFSPLYSPNVWYPAGVANCFSDGIDISPGVSDIEIRFNSSLNWYFGTNGSVPPGAYDFITVMLKKLLQAYALTSSVHDISGQAACKYGAYPDNYLTSYDNLVKSNSSTTMNSFTVTPSTAFTSWVTNNLYWSDIFPYNKAHIANNNSPIKIYTPSSFNNTVSLNNIDETTYQNGSSSILSPVINLQEAIHNLQGVPAEMVRDVQNYGHSVVPCLFDYVKISNVPVPSVPTTLLTVGGNYNYAPNFHDETGATCGGGYNNLVGYSWKFEVPGNDGNVYTLTTGNAGLFTITNLALPVLPAGVDYLRNYDNSIRGFVKLIATENNGHYLYDNIQVKIKLPCSSNVAISGLYSTNITQSSTWIKSTGTTTIVNSASVKLDADPVNGYVLLKPVAGTDYFLSAPSANGMFIAQALDGCGDALPMRPKQMNHRPIKKN